MKEYQVVWLTLYGARPGAGPGDQLEVRDSNIRNIQESLNQQARQGWELKQAVGRGGGNFILILERER